MIPKNADWLISDTHFGHRNIVKFQQRPETHEIIIISEWIKRVRDEDRIIHLGDVWIRASNWRWAAIISRLPGKKFLIKGNHDGAGDEWYERAGFEIIDPFIHDGFAFTHRPISADFPHLGLAEYELGGADKRSPDFWEACFGKRPEIHTNIHGHTHSNMFNPKHDGLTDTNLHYVNVCVEHTNLAPVQLGQIWR